jgi:hypothetical protein
MELWKDIKGFEGHYKISNYGNVMSIKRDREKILKNRVNAFGYHHVSLRKDGKAYEKLVHRLVAENFSDAEHKETVNHKDGNKINNHISNLEWATKKEQMVHAYKHHLKAPVSGITNGNHVLSVEEVKEIRSIYKPHSKEYGMRALAKKYKVSESTIDKLVRNKTYKELL